MRSEQTPSRRGRRLSRRAFVTTSAAGVAGLAGCAGSSDSPDSGDDTSGDPDDGDTDEGPPEAVPFVEDPPATVYLPTHREPVEMHPVVEASEYALLPHFSYPHQFWLVDGEDTEAVLPTLEDSTHLMVMVWDRETGELLPVDAGATMEIRRDGDPVETVAPWPMLAQTMGFHFGDNVPLPGDGTYTVEVTMNPIEQIRKTGGFAGRFAETETATFEFEWSETRRRDLRDAIEFLEESRWGERGALEPMAHGSGSGGSGGEHGHGNVPPPSLPTAGEYPGADLGVHESGDARFVVRYLEGSRLAADGGSYLLVSPRTPYNRLPLPDMSLTLSLSDADVALTQTLDGEFGLHYGTSIALSPGETFELVVDAPPQIARHRGYETAFLDMPPMTVEREP